MKVREAVSKGERSKSGGRIGGEVKLGVIHITVKGSVKFWANISVK